VSVEELCLNQPPEFKEFMNYCRGLAFEADPDYRYIISLFEGCMERHNFELRTPDFIWNKNRLFLERQTLKESMMRVINKPAVIVGGAKPRAIAAADNEEANNERGGAEDQ
jgi:hypothetical protein